MGSSSSSPDPAAARSAASASLSRAVSRSRNLQCNPRCQSRDPFRGEGSAARKSQTHPHGFRSVSLVHEGSGSRRLKGECVAHYCTVRHHTQSPLQAPFWSTRVLPRSPGNRNRHREGFCKGTTFRVSSRHNEGACTDVRTVDMSAGSGTPFERAVAVGDQRVQLQCGDGRHRWSKARERPTHPPTFHRICRSTLRTNQSTRRPYSLQLQHRRPGTTWLRTCPDAPHVSVSTHARTRVKLICVCCQEDGA
jgi:hypothetical protein